MNRRTQHTSPKAVTVNGLDVRDCDGVLDTVLETLEEALGNFVSEDVAVFVPEFDALSVSVADPVAEPVLVDESVGVVVVLLDSDEELLGELASVFEADVLTVSDFVRLAVDVIVLDFEQKNPTHVVVAVRLTLTGLFVAEEVRDMERLRVSEPDLDTVRLTDTDCEGIRDEVGDSVVEAERLPVGVEELTTVIDADTLPDMLRDIDFVSVFDNVKLAVDVIVFDFEQKNPTHVAVAVRLTLTGLFVAEEVRDMERLRVSEPVLDTDLLVDTVCEGIRDEEEESVVEADRLPVGVIAEVDEGESVFDGLDEGVGEFACVGVLEVVTLLVMLPVIDLVSVFDSVRLAVNVIVLDFEQKNPTHVAVAVRLTLTGLLVNEGDREAERLELRELVLDTERLVETDCEGLRDEEGDVDAERLNTRLEVGEPVLDAEILLLVLPVIDFVGVYDGVKLAVNVIVLDFEQKNPTHVGVAV